jgi:hypothetical protein
MSTDMTRAELGNAGAIIAARFDPLERLDDPTSAWSLLGNTDNSARLAIGTGYSVHCWG